jgi:hypothetical protein
MISRLLLTTIAFLPLLSAEESTDLLRFDNGDQLHGEFHGVSETASLLWKRNKLDEQTIGFATSDLRQVVLRGGKPVQSLGGLSHVGTVNGDRIPGVVQELDDKRLLLQTEFSGLLEIPRNQVGIIAPSPMGGRVLYLGPFNKEEWVQTNQKYPKGIPMEEKESDKKVPFWKFSGAAWYWPEDGLGTALTRQAGLPDRSVIQFDIAWKNRLSTAIAFHADFEVPESAKLPEHHLAQRSSMVSDLPGIFGSSYVLHIYSNYVVLHRTGFHEDGKPFMDRLPARNSNLRLSNTGSAKVEIRCNRLSGEIMLFVNDEHVCKWNEISENLAEDGMDARQYAGKGGGYGFIGQTEGSPVRISNIVVAEWNGIPDSARSLESQDSDIILLNNGTDRFSGRVAGIKDGKVSMSGRYGDFSFPITEIAELRFAKSQLKSVDESQRNSMKVRFHPLGAISGQMLSGDPKSVRLLSPAAGEIHVDLNTAIMLEFKSNQSYLDDWNVEF